MTTSSGTFNIASNSHIELNCPSSPREKKEAALEQSQTTLQTDEAPKKGKKADNSLFDLLDDGDAVSDEEGGGLMVCLLHALNFPICHRLTYH